MPLITVRAGAAPVSAPAAERRSHAAQQLLEDVDGVATAGAEVGQRGEGELGFGQRQCRGLELEPAVPADRCRRRPGGLEFREQDEVVERVIKGEAAEFLGRDLCAAYVLCAIARA